VKKEERETCRAASGNKDAQGYRIEWHAEIWWEDEKMMALAEQCSGWYCRPMVLCTPPAFVPGMVFQLGKTGIRLQS